MASQMQFKIRRLSELPVAIRHGARIGFFASVEPCVRLQMRLLLEGLFANVAHESSDVVVNEHVLSEQAFGPEYFVTNLAGDVAARRR